MAKPAPATVDAYLASLPEDRRAVVAAVRDAVNRRLPKGYREGMQYGMIGWCVPHSLYPAGYHADPRQGLPFAGLASRKDGVSLHLTCVYGDDAARRRFEAAWRRTGKPLDMGKACVRFQRIEDVPLDVITDTIASVPVEGFVRAYEAGRASARRPGKA